MIPRSVLKCFAFVVASLGLGYCCVLFFMIGQQRTGPEPFVGGDSEFSATVANELKQIQLVQAFQVAQEVVATGNYSHRDLLIASGLRTLSGVTIEDSLPEHLLIQAHRFLQTQPEQAADLIDHFLAQSPNHGVAQGWYGQLIVKTSPAEYTSWEASLPEDVQQHPEVWFARGLAAEENNEHDLAAACFFKALAADRLRADIAVQFASSAGEVPQLTKFRQQANEFSRVLTHLNLLLHDLELTQDFSMMQEAAKILDSLGYPIIAKGWKETAKQLGCREEWCFAGQRPVDDRFTEMFTKLESSQWHTEARFLDWTEYRITSVNTQSTLVDTPVRFQDVATEMGLYFRYENGGDPDLLLRHLFESVGGGVTVLDFDVDGWPDLYLAQGGSWKTQKDIPVKTTDRLFQNQHGRHFIDCTFVAGLVETDFSHGVTQGDFNNDGFPDLYVCNLGQNRLFENLGDGTFQEVTALSHTAGDAWSLSAGFADLNGDGLSDLFVVNYMDAAEVRGRPCEHLGQPRTCPPSQFAGKVDNVYINLGNGKFSDVSGLNGVSDSPGKGMGLIIADFDDDGQLEVFVGNDSEENAYWVASSEQSQQSLLQYSNQAVVQGLATDGEGRKQACMGIAAADLFATGRLDLLVTNFYGESNTIYRQTDQGGFYDATLEAGVISASSTSTLGFGTQTIDADLDGNWDLMVVNGHVDRTQVTGRPDRMLPQMFVQTEQQQFFLADPTQVGDFFARPTLGRAVAKIDFNRDGRGDLCVTHLDEPAALLENQTRATGNTLQLRLIGTNKERNPVGCRVAVTCGEHTWTQQVTAGDGYEACNESLLTFGLRDYQVADTITLHWTPERSDTFHSVYAGNRYICIEGIERIFPIHSLNISK